MDYVAVQMEMMRLEAVHGDEHPPVAKVMANMLGLDYDQAFLRAVSTEIMRANSLLERWYGEMGMEKSALNALGLGLAQGVAFALAVRGLQENAGLEGQ